MGTPGVAAAKATPPELIPPACFEPDAFLIEDAGLVLREGTGGVRRVSNPIPPGTFGPGRYAITLWTADDHGPGSRTQSQEQWRVELSAGGELLYASGPTDDLPDGVNVNSTLVGPDVVLEQAPDTVTAIHVGEGQTVDVKPESLYAVCMVLAPLHDPIVVTKLVDADGDGDFSASEARVEGAAGPATFSVTVENPRSVAVTIETLVDDIEGDLDGVGTCTTPITIEPGEAATCVFGIELEGQNAGTAYRNIVTAVPAVGDPASSAAEVVFTDEIPSATASLTGEDELEAPGGVVTYTVAVTNTSGVTDPLVLETLDDDRLGSLLDPANPKLQATSCAVTRIPVGATHECTYKALVEGDTGRAHDNEVTATLRDDEANPVMVRATHQVTFTRGTAPRPQVVLADTEVSDQPTPQGTYRYVITIFNVFDVSTTSEDFALQLPAGVFVAGDHGPSSVDESVAANTCVLFATDGHGEADQAAQILGRVGDLGAGEVARCELRVRADLGDDQVVEATITLLDTGDTDEEPTRLVTPAAVAGPPAPETAPTSEDAPPGLAFTGLGAGGLLGAALALVAIGGFMTGAARLADTRRGSIARHRSPDG